MFISTKGRYGLRAMFELARAWNTKSLSLRQIATAQSLSESYLEQLFPLLKSAGLVESTRGAYGGYRLVKPPEDISVGSILTALEGALTPSDCVNDGADCQNAPKCAAHSVWRRIYDGLQDVVNGISLKDMLEDEEKLIKG